MVMAWSKHEDSANGGGLCFMHSSFPMRAASAFFETAKPGSRWAGAQPSIPCHDKASQVVPRNSDTRWTAHRLLSPGGSWVGPDPMGAAYTERKWKVKVTQWCLLLSHFSRVRLCATPWTAAHQAPLSLRFSRQEHWSGLPLPSPMHESEKWKWSCSVISDSSRPHGPQPTTLLHPWDFPGKTTGVGCHCLLLSGVWPFAIPWTVPCQAPLSMEFSRPEYWSK